MEGATVDDWMSFFRDAGIPPNVSASYASSFCQNRINLNMVLELNRDLLKELGVTLVGDAIAILRHAKSFHEQNVRQRILKSMSSENQKPAEFSEKLVSATDVASLTTNSKKFDGDISGQVVSPMGNNRSSIAVACRNSNNQEILRMRQMQHTPTQYSLQRYGISTGRSVTAASSQTDNIIQNNCIGPLNRDELLLCEAPIPTIGEADTTEDIDVSHISSRSQNTHRASHLERFVESSSTLPSRQVTTVPTHSSGSSYFCKKNQGLKRPIQQSNFATIVSPSQQYTRRLLHETPSAPAAHQSSLKSIGENTFQDAHDELLTTPDIKRRRTLSPFGPLGQEQIKPNICTQSLGTGSGSQYIRETRSSTTTNHSEESQVQESPQLYVNLPKQSVSSNVNNEMTVAEDFTESQANSEQQCQLPLQRRQEVSPVKVCAHLQSQETIHMSHSFPETRLQSRIMAESETPSHVILPSQMPFQRISESHSQYQASLKLHHETQSPLPRLLSVQPQTKQVVLSQALCSQAGTHKNLQLQNEEVIKQHNPARSCSTAKLILTSGKKIKDKFKLLQARCRTACLDSVPQSLQSSGNPNESDVQRPVKSVAISRCSNKSVPKEIKNQKKKVRPQTMLESGKETSVSWNGPQTEVIGADGNLLEEERNNTTDLKTGTSTVGWDTHHRHKSVTHSSSNSCLYDGSSSHTFDNLEEHFKRYGHQPESDLQFERVPGQIFSRLGVKAEVITSDNGVNNGTAKNDCLSSCHLYSSDNVAKTVTNECLPKSGLIKRKIVFRPFQKTKAFDRKNVVADHTSQIVASIDEKKPKLRGILKPQTITLEQQDGIEPQEETQSQRMTAHLLLESVAKSGATELGIVPDIQDHFEENSLSSSSTKSEEGDCIYQSGDNFCSDDEHSTVPISGACTSKTVHFGPVCVKEFQKNVPPSSVTTVINSRPPIFSRLGARRKRIY